MYCWNKYGRAKNLELINTDQISKSIQKKKILVRVKININNENNKPKPS